MQPELKIYSMSFKKQLRGTTFHRLPHSGSGLIGVSVGGITQAWAEPLSIAAASETHQEGLEHSFLFSAILFSLTTCTSTFLSFCFSLQWKQSVIYLTLSAPELALTLRTRTGQRQVEISVGGIHCVNTWWNMVAVSGYKWGLRFGGTGDNVLMWQDMTRSLL